jgi:hypothetical protein
MRHVERGAVMKVVLRYAFCTLVSLYFCSAAHAITYRYIGNHFNFVWGSYKATDHITVSLNLDGPLPPNNCNGSSLLFSCNSDITNLPGFALQMSDGVNNFTSKSQDVRANVSTDAKGRIQYWFFSLADKNPFPTTFIRTGYMSESGIPLFSTDMVGNGSAPGGGSASGGYVENNPGRWSGVSLPPPSGAVCNGSYSGVFNGNLILKGRQSCIILGGEITGNIIQLGGQLVLNDVKVGGNVDVSGPSTFLFNNTNVKGNVSVRGTTGAPQNELCASPIGGSLLLQNNSAPVQIGGLIGSTCSGNNFANNVSVNNNSGLVQLFNNRISRNLSCAGNNPLPIGSDNLAASMQGQCSGL